MTVNTIVKAALGDQLKKAKEKNVTLTQLCQRCGAPNPGRIIDSNKCLLGGLWGVCPYRNCRKQHTPLTDSESNTVVDHLRPLKEDTDRILEG